MTKGAIRLFLSLIILLPVIIYFMAWDYYAINIPKWDDHAFKTFIVDYAHATNWQEKFQALFKQHNEHRVFITRLFSWLDYSTFGSLNYRHLMFAGNLLLIGVIPLWYVILTKNKKPLSTLLPIPFIWLTLAFWENMYWGMAAVQNFGVVTFFLWTIFLCLNTNIWIFVLSLILAWITILTSGTGFLVLPIGAILLFLAKDKKRFALWLINSAAAAFCYFYTYVKPNSNPPVTASILQLVKGYMAFLGSFAESIPVLDHFRVCVLLGVVLFLVAVSICFTTLFRIIRNKYSVDFERVTDLFCLGATLFILGTALLAVYSRAGFGLEGLISSKYKIYSVLLLIVTYLYVVIPIRGSFLSPYITAIVFLGITFNVFSYHYHLVDAYNLRKELVSGQFNGNYLSKDLEVADDTSFASKIVTKTPVIYESWLPFIEIADRQTYSGNTSGLTALYDKTNFQKTASTFNISNDSFTSQRLQDSGIYVLLRSKNRYYVFPTYRTRNKSRKDIFLKQYYFSPGFHNEIPFSSIDEGTYDVAILRQEGDKTGILYRDQKVYIPATEKTKVKVNW